jgi:hypothetical protein
MRNVASPLLRLALVVPLLAGLSLTGCVVKGRPGPNAADRRAERRDDRQDARFDAASRWDKLGERWVDGKVDRDVIHVGRKDGRFRKIQLVIEHSSVELYDLDIVFGDGSHFSPGTRLAFGPNSTTQIGRAHV